MKVLLVDNHLPSLETAYFGLLYHDFQVEASADPAEIGARIHRFRPDVLIVGNCQAQADPETLCQEFAHLPVPVIIRVKDPASIPPTPCPGAQFLAGPVDIPRLIQTIAAASSTGQ